MASKKPLDKRYESAKERLAGVKGAQAWIHDLMAQHLLKSEHPISDEPIEGKGPEPK
jgi:hypothetical protein